MTATPSMRLYAFEVEERFRNRFPSMAHGIRTTRKFTHRVDGVSLMINKNSLLDGGSVMVTGGTGSFGKKFVATLVELSDSASRIFLKRRAEAVRDGPALPRTRISRDSILYR